MPDLPQTINLPTETKSWSPELLRNWTLMIQTLNALSRVDLAANKPPTPDLDHIFFTESDGSQITYIAVNGVWRALTGSGAASSVSSSSGSYLTIDGIEGDIGPQGPAGPQGPGGSGATGAQGPTGPAVFLQAEILEGDIGPPGVRGVDGPTGPPGTTGAQGPTGPAIFLDAEGPEGEQGPPGPMGVTGAVGQAGTTGAQGPTGPAIFLDAEPGEDAIFGPPGQQGLTGAGGLTLTAFTKDLGASNNAGTFDITGLAGLTTDKPVLIAQTAAAIASKGNARDEAEMDQIQVTGYVLNSTTIRAYWNAPSVVVGTYAFGYQVSG